MNLRILIAFFIGVASVGPSFSADQASDSAPSGLAQQAPAPGVTATLPGAQDRASLKKASVGSKLFVAPVLLPGKVATLTAVDQNNRALPNVSLLVNGVPVETNQEGRARFVIDQKAGAAVIVLPVEDQSNDVRVDYAITSCGALVVDPSLIKFVDGLFSTAPKRDPAPRILYAPLLVQPGRPASVIGLNFDGQAGGDKLQVDNVECQILASSPVSLLAMMPPKMPSGQLREMLVTSHGESSMAVEVDAVGVNTTFDIIDGATDGLFKVDVAGTRLPVLLRYENNAPSAVSLSSTEGTQLPQAGWAMTPGGDDGVIGLRANVISSVSSPISVEVAPDLAILPDAAEDESVRTLAKTLLEARIARLKRQMIAIETQLSEAQRARAAAVATGAPPGEEVERLTAELNTLSLRQSRMATALNSQRAIFLALGGSEEKYRAALDEAAGGAYLTTERKPGAADNFATNAVKAEARRQRRLAEPRMKLLPPEEWNGTDFVEVATSSSTASPVQSPSPASEKPDQVIQKDDTTPPVITMPAKPSPATPPVVVPGASKPGATTKPAATKPATTKGKPAAGAPGATDSTAKKVKPASAKSGQKPAPKTKRSAKKTQPRGARSRSSSVRAARGMRARSTASGRVVRRSSARNSTKAKKSTTVPRKRKR